MLNLMVTVNNNAAGITAIATLAIAWFTWLNYKMYRAIQKKDEEYKRKTRDLYEAIVVATLVASGRAAFDFGGIKNTFNAHYKGETPIFR